MLKTLLLLLAASLFSTTTIACDNFPSPVNGMQAIYENVKYPETAKKDNIQGKVLIEVIILSDGSIGELSIKESAHPDLDRAAAEAVRAVKWQPGSEDGKPSSCTVAIPVVFKLKVDKEKQSAAY